MNDCLFCDNIALCMNRLFFYSVYITGFGYGIFGWIKRNAFIIINRNYPRACIITLACINIEEAANPLNPKEHPVTAVPLSFMAKASTSSKETSDGKSSSLV